MYSADGFIGTFCVTIKNQYPKNNCNIVKGTKISIVYTT